MAFRLHPKNCLGVRQFAETMMCTTLYDSANSFLQQHFVEVSVSDEFLGLRTEEVLELVGCDELNIKAEEQVRHASPATTRGQRTCSPWCAGTPRRKVPVEFVLPVHVCFECGVRVPGR